MSKAVLHIILLMLALNCKGQAFDYPAEIKAQGLEKLYDKAKYYLYATQGPLKLKFRNLKDAKAKNISCGMLPLNFDHLEVRGDTIEMDFFFYYQNKRVDGRLVENIPLWGVVFVGNTDKIIMLSSRTDVRYYSISCPESTPDCKGYETYMTTDSNLKYIKQNKSKLDPWFRKEAIKRGIISE